MPNPLDPIALDASPGQAFASHRARANGIAQFYAANHPLSTVSGTANEDNTITLIAHLHAATCDPTFKVGEDLSLTAAPQALRRLNKGNGLVGSDQASTKRDYDFALKSLMAIAYRYQNILSSEDVKFILENLVPGYLSGGHPAEIEIVELTFLNIDSPETENHLLMIESSRYLVNQLLHKQPGDVYDNATNGLTEWLLAYMQRISKHDFLEFSARPYARLALHALLNLYEFGEPKIRTAAQILLDYTMVKFALSSNRGRRVTPFRRHQHRINHQANDLNDLYAPGGDQIAAYFVAYMGQIDAQGKLAKLPEGLVRDTHGALIAGTAAYRPPPAAYILAMNAAPPFLHRFFHGTRPQLPGSSDTIDSGLEIYYRSPSFLLSAGGSFLNSGYGSDESGWGDKTAWEETSRAQATTLIPTRTGSAIEPKFHDLLRFEPYPDPLVDPYADDPNAPHCYHTTAVNIGVHRGIAAGANLRPAEKKSVLEHSTSASPSLTAHGDKLMIAWKGSGNDAMNVATVQSTSLLGIDGVEGIEERITLTQQTTDAAPALASHDGRLFLAWKGSGNVQLNLAGSSDNGKTWKTRTFADASDYGPALVSHAGRLFLAWVGHGNEKLNVAKVVIWANSTGAWGIEGLEGKAMLEATSSAPPALASHNGRLFLAWKGSGNDTLNLQLSEDQGASFRATTPLPETSSQGPSLASHAGRLFLGWRGSGNKVLNVAKVVLVDSTAGAFGIEGIGDKAILGETSTNSPALASRDGKLFIAWEGESKDHLNLRVSQDGSFQVDGPWRFLNLKHLGFYVAVYRALPAHPEDLDPPPESLAILYAMEADTMDFSQFVDLTVEGNINLPKQIAYGSNLDFHSPDGKHFKVWFLLTTQKYTERVSEASNPFADLDVLPLVSGDYMNAPGGHDGVIKIHHPGCENFPLVLDFHDSSNPIYRDNIGECPQPWLERADALAALAGQLAKSGDSAGATAALIDRVEILARLSQIDSVKYGPLLGAALIDLVGRHRAELGSQAALSWAQRGVQVYEELAGLRPAGSTTPVNYENLAAFTPNTYWWDPSTGGLASALWFLALAYREANNDAAAATILIQRVRLAERLAGADPNTYKSLLVHARADAAAFGFRPRL